MVLLEWCWYSIDFTNPIDLHPPPTPPLNILLSGLPLHFILIPCTFVLEWCWNRFHKSQWRHRTPQGSIHWQTGTFALKPPL